MKASVFTLAQMASLAVAIAIPQDDGAETVASTGAISDSTLQLCEEAPNCEIWQSEHGPMIRFKPGMEPGSDDYAARFPNATTAGETGKHLMMKRNTQTIVTFGDTAINYGSTNPCDALHHCLFDYCHEGACDQGTCTTGTQVVGHVQGVGSTSPVNRQLSINAFGHYPGWDARDDFVNAVVAAASHGQKWTEQQWCINTKEGCDGGALWVGKQTNFIDVSKWYNGALHGQITATAKMDSGDGGWCAVVAGMTAAIAGAINPIAGGFFGFVSAGCGIH